MKQCCFEGWYFKHQRGSDMLALIPGRAESGAFVQMISSRGSRQFRVPGLTVRDGVIRAGKCSFSRGGCRIDLPGIWGEITYGPIQSLVSDIMGPFRHLPMECRHGVISMGHELRGSVRVDGETFDFDGGTGYIEKDSGRSFPKSYLWMQCSGFQAPCSIMLALAEIPFWGGGFRGCICAIIYGGREYRFATYNGVKVRGASGDHVSLSQGKFHLEVDMRPGDGGHSLAAPIRGRMSGAVRECCNALVRVRLWEGDRQVFDLISDRAAYEFVPTALH